MDKFINNNNFLVFLYYIKDKLIHKANRCLALENLLVQGISLMSKTKITDISV